MAPLTLTRSDGPQVSLVGIPGNPKTAAMSIPLARNFTIGWGVPAPPKLRITLQRSDVNDWVRVTFVHSVGTFIVKRDFSGSALPLAASVAEIDASTGDTYYYNPVTELLTVKLLVRTGRTSTTIQVIPN